MKDSSYCTGCGACVASCTKNAIKLQTDDEGFLFPKVNAERCVGCGVCDSVCENAYRTPLAVPNTQYISYALSAKERCEGSSGGFFGVLAESVLKEGGVVFGAAYIPEEKKVKHVSTATVLLERIKRSKYVQSDTGNTFKEVKKLCDISVPVLYVGTPCQINGLKAFLGREYNTLLTMDFICHGVPSPKLFADLIKSFECKNGLSVTDITFREKKLGWRNQTTSVYFEDGSIITEKSEETFYYNAFFHNLSLRKSCFSCERYKSHAADLTASDFWKIDKSRDDDQGVSLINVNTDRGRVVLNSIRDKLFLEPYKEEAHERFSHKSYDVEKRNGFFIYYLKNGVDSAVTNINEWLPNNASNQQGRLAVLFNRLHKLFRKN